MLASTRKPPGSTSICDIMHLMNQLSGITSMNSTVYDTMSIYIYMLQAEAEVI